MMLPVCNRNGSLWYTKAQTPLPDYSGPCKKNCRCETGCDSSDPRPVFFEQALATLDHNLHPRARTQSHRTYLTPARPRRISPSSSSCAGSTRGSALDGSDAQWAPHPPAASTGPSSAPKVSRSITACLKREDASRSAPASSPGGGARHAWRWTATRTSPRSRCCCSRRRAAFDNVTTAMTTTMR